MNTESLAQVAANIVVKAAVTYLQVHHLTADQAALAECCKSWTRIKLPEAIRDAKEAMDCHMHQAAEATFKASLIQAGIEAAREASRPPVTA